MESPPTPLMFAMACWGICWTVYLAQFFGADDLLPAPFFYLALLAFQTLPFSLAASFLFNPPPGNGAAAVPASCVGFAKGLLFLAILAHLFLNAGSLLAAKHTVVSAYFVVALNAIGYALIAMVRTTESSLGFLVCFLTGVAWNSYKGLHPHAEGFIYKALVCVLSVAVVFLCGMYSQQAVPDADDKAGNSSPEEGLPAKVDGADGASDDTLHHPLVSVSV